MEIKCQYCGKQIKATALATGPNGCLYVADCDGCPKTPDPFITSPSTYLLSYRDSSGALKIEVS